MQRSNSLGYLAYPLLTLSFLGAALTLHAQDAPAAPQQAPAAQPDQPQQPDAAPPNSSSQTPNYPNEQERVRLAREAQGRVQARRQQRVQAVIQDTYSHKFDVYFGYAYLRMRPGHSLQHVTEYGWNAGITEYIRPKLGITGDFRGYYGTAYTGNNPGNNGFTFFKPFISNYSVMAGPQYRFVEGKTWGVSGQVLAGGSRTLFQGDSEGFPGTLLGLYPSEWSFSAAAGVSVDYNLGPGLAVRITPTYYLTRFGGDTQHNLGFTAGMNYRFGRH